jgi:hypothetical protein
VRTLFAIEGSHNVACLQTAAVCTKALLFILETKEKRSLIRLPWRTPSVETTSGAISRALFLWLNRTFVQGFRSLLTVDTLAPLEDCILAASDAEMISERWDRGKLEHRLSLANH